MLERARDVHHSSKSFFERCYVDCACLGDLIGPLRELHCSLLREAELVAAVDESESKP